MKGSTLGMVSGLAACALACGYPEGPCPDAEERYVPEVRPELGYPSPGPVRDDDPEWECPSGDVFDADRHYIFGCGPAYCDEAYVQNPEASWYCVRQSHLDDWMDEHCVRCWLNHNGDPYWITSLVCGEQEK